MGGQQVDWGSVSPFNPRSVAVALSKQLQHESKPVVENWSKTMQEASKSVKDKAVLAKQHLVEFNATVLKQARERLENDAGNTFSSDSSNRCLRDSAGAVGSVSGSRNAGTRVPRMALGTEQGSQTDLLHIFNQILEQMTVGTGASPRRASSYRSQATGDTKGDTPGLEEAAMQLVASSKVALEHAGKSIEETASNCQQNMTHLRTFLRDNLSAMGDFDAAAKPWSMDGGSVGQDADEAWIKKRLAIPLFLLTKRLELGPHDASRSKAGRVRRRRGGSSLREERRAITIVTTASLPWMTGTAVNPLLRAAYLSSMYPGKELVYPGQQRFATPKEQEEYVREWVEKRTGAKSTFKMVLYPGRFSPRLGCIFPQGDLIAKVPPASADVAVLEEPEHLNWYHHGQRWSDAFNHVVGVVHTNYLDYARREGGGELLQALISRFNQMVCRAHCHKVIKLSDAVQPLPRELTEFVHGVSPDFLAVGAAPAGHPPAAAGAAAPLGIGLEGDEPRGAAAYFLGKVLWAKGYSELLQLMRHHVRELGPAAVQMDVFGTGPDIDAVVAASSAARLPLSFHGPRDHLHRSLHDYKVFVNPSLSDVVATTTAEALAMGKFVVCAQHPSNRFFAENFRNCLVFSTPSEFSQQLQHALHHEPAALTARERELLSWENATERFLDAAALSDRDVNPGPLQAFLDGLAHQAHQALTGLYSLQGSVHRDRASSDIHSVYQRK